MKHKILELLSADCPWRDSLHWFDSTDSTNNRAKLLAQQGAPHGTVLIAGHQTGGRGRMGRTFQSPSGMGVYLSVILRPQCKPQEIMHLTCAAAVAMCRAIEAVTGLRPGIKWINDLIWNKKKLGGILTELAVDPKTGLTDYAIVGIGINCRQQAQDFPPELRSMAASLSMAAGKDICPQVLAAAMIEQLVQMDAALTASKAQLMALYRQNCITLGKEVSVHRADTVRHGKALELDSDGGLLVAYSDGTAETVNAGEVSVRGMYGYL